jgi:hypothetical protein
MGAVIGNLLANLHSPSWQAHRNNPLLSSFVREQSISSETFARGLPLIALHWPATIPYNPYFTQNAQSISSPMLEEKVRKVWNKQGGK